jgi:hypothetical protein
MKSLVEQLREALEKEEMEESGGKSARTIC